MKLRVKTASLKQTLEWIERGFFAGAILALGYCGYIRADTWMFQRHEKQNLEHRLNDVASLAPAAASDGLIGRIDIQRLGVSVLVVEGTGDVTLQRAAGHIAGTALPGQAGNIGIAAHRDTFFRPLRNIRHDDIITLTTAHGEYRYHVVSAKVVNPDDVAVLNPDGHEVLTLVTCYPFYFIGSAPNRFIVRAVRIL